MTKPGPLGPADEGLNHQIVDTFSRVVESDRSWTEKIWAMAAARDGSVSVAFGLGKYVNRNVMDGFAGVSRGTEQWAVRASRRLSPDTERNEIGPIAYDVTGPLQRTRYRLAHQRRRPDPLRHRDRGAHPADDGGARNPRQPQPIAYRRRHHALPSGRRRSGLGGDRRRAHRGRPRGMGRGPRPVVGGPLRDRGAADGHRAHAGPARHRGHVRVDARHHDPPRRSALHPLRLLPELSGSGLVDRQRTGGHRAARRPHEDLPRRDPRARVPTTTTGA